MGRTPEELLTPPCDLEAERALLGSILLDHRVLNDLDGLRPRDFYSERHGKLFEHLVAMHEAGKPIDLKLLAEHLKRYGDLEVCGGADFIAELMTAVPHPHHAKYYAGIVREKAMRRALIEAGHMLCKQGYDEQLSFDEAVDFAESALLRLGTVSPRHTRLAYRTAQLRYALRWTVSRRIGDTGGENFGRQDFACLADRGVQRTGRSADVHRKL